MPPEIADSYDDENDDDRRTAISAAFDNFDEDNLAEITEPLKPEPAKAPAEGEVGIASNAVETEAVAPKEPVEEDKAPASWTPGSREQWANIPEGVRGEIAKREKELQRSLNDTAQARQFTEYFREQVSPYEGMFRAQGVDAITGIGNVLQTAAQLQMGTPVQRAQAAANVIQQFGVDIATLDDLLVGNMPKSAPNEEVAQLQAQLYQMQQYVQQQQHGQQQQTYQQQQKINQETQEFLAKNEFANDLRGVMADFMDVAELQGRQMTLKQAYDSALATRPDIQEIVTNRGTSKNNQRAVAGARRAAASVPQSHGTGAGPSAPTTTREALLAAWDDHS